MRNIRGFVVMEWFKEIGKNQGGYPEIELKLCFRRMYLKTLRVYLGVSKCGYYCYVGKEKKGDILKKKWFHKAPCLKKWRLRK